MTAVVLASRTGSDVDHRRCDMNDPEWPGDAVMLGHRDVFAFDEEVTVKAEYWLVIIIARRVEKTPSAHRGDGSACHARPTGHAKSAAPCKRPWPAAMQPN